MTHNVSKHVALTDTKT